MVNKISGKPATASKLCVTGDGRKLIAHNNHIKVLSPLGHGLLVTVVSDQWA